MGPTIFVRYSRDLLQSSVVKIYVVRSQFVPKFINFFVRFKREFVITVVVITEFDCN